MLLSKLQLFVQGRYVGSFWNLRVVEHRLIQRDTLWMNLAAVFKCSSKTVFLNISQYSQENTRDGVFLN